MYLLREARALLVLAFPILLAQLSLTAMSLVDTIMAGHYGRYDLAAIAVGGSLWLPALLFTEAVLMAITPFVAFARGRNDMVEARATLYQGLWLGILVGSFVAVLLLLSIPLLGLMQVASQILSITEDYLLWIACGLPAVGLYRAMRSFVEGQGRVLPVVLVNLAGLLCNIPLNYLFIYGGFGISPMGGAGCGVATALVCGLMGCFLAVYVWYRDLRQPLVGRVSVWPHWSRLKVLLSVGLPMGLAMFAEVSIFAVLALLIAPLGADLVAGHQIALNLTTQIFMVPFSLSMALTIRVGYLLGKDKKDVIRSTCVSGFTLAIFGALCTAALMVFGGETIAAMYTSDTEIQAIAVALLLFAAAYQVPDALQVSSSGILRGFKITREPMFYTLFTYWCVALPLGYVLALTDLLVAPMGPQGLWLALVVGLSLAACLLLRRLYQVFDAF